MDVSGMVRLRELAEKAHFSSAQIAEKNAHIAATILLESPDLQQPNFRAIHPDDLRRLFELYDQLYFDALCRTCLEGSALRFRISRRMTRVGGTTTRIRRRGRPAIQSFEIAVASTLLFETFSDVRRPIFVNGLECRNRLEALQRIMEHELIHLVELLIWDDSRCSARRFQSIAARFFGHTDHRHQLVTPRERASTTLGIRPGTRVRFRLDGSEHVGLINRITKRATVLVESANGRTYSDGRRYAVYYVPIGLLQPLE
jgi:hypothetical protein